MNESSISLVIYNASYSSSWNFSKFCKYIDERQTKIQSNSMFNSLHTIDIEMKQIHCMIVLTIVSFIGGGLVCTVLTTSKYMLQSAPLVTGQYYRVNL